MFQNCEIARSFGFRHLTRLEGCCRHCTVSLKAGILKRFIRALPPGFKVPRTISPCRSRQIQRYRGLKWGQIRPQQGDLPRSDPTRRLTY
jgi:hypothetical protein